MTTHIRFVGIALSFVGITSLVGACAQDGDEIVQEELSGIESPIELEPVATFDATNGLQFASPDIAVQWREEAPGVWRHETGTQRLIMGEQGHRSAVSLVEAELAELRSAGADNSLIAAKESYLASQRNAVAKAASEVSPQVSCRIRPYNGPSSPFTGYVGGAALVELVCYGGTVRFTIDTQVCTGTTGCGPVLRQIAYPTSTPGLWGQARSGYGTCYSFVAVSPPGIFEDDYYRCG